MISQVSQGPAEGSYVDFKDKDTNDWQVGFILLKTVNHLKIRSEGWSSKYDEIVPIASNRIKPFRSIVRGYTGQQKNSALREHWKYSESNHSQRWQLLQAFLKNKDNSEHQWVQFARGSHYFYLDFLMSQTFATADQVERAYEYFKAHIEWVKSYLLKIAEKGYFKWASNNQISKQQKQAFYELFDGVNIIAGLYPRHSNFFSNNEKRILSVTSNVTHQKFIGQLIKESSLDLVYHKAIGALNDQTQPLPTNFIYAFFRMFLPIQKGLLRRTECGQIQKKERKIAVMNLVELVKKSLDRLKVDELKQPQTEKQIESLNLDLFTTSFKYSLDKLTLEWSKKMKIKIYTMLLDTDSVERRLRGISKLKESFQTIITPNDYALYRLPVEDYMDILRKEDVLKKIFIQNEHPEIAKKGGEFWSILVSHGLIPFPELELIWDSGMGKHESVKKIIFQFWIDLIPFAQKEVNKLAGKIVQRYKKEENLSGEEWQLEMELAFAEKLFKFYSQLSQMKEENDKMAEQFLWICYKNILKAKQQIDLSQKITKFAKLIIFSDHFNDIIKECYIQIGKGQHLKYHIELLLQFYSNSVKTQTFLAANALKIIYAAFEKAPELSESIFRLITEVVNFSTQFAGYQLFDLPSFQELWKISHQNNDIKRHFYGWLLKQHNNPLTGLQSHQINMAIPDDLREEIFRQFLCDFAKIDYINLTLDEFNIFKEFLLDTNAKQDRIQAVHFAGMIRAIKIKAEEIIGNKFVWDIFLNCKNVEVLKKLNELIIVLHLHCQTACNQKIRMSKLSVLMLKIEKNLKNGYRKGNNRILRASLELLKAVIDFVKEKPEAKGKHQTYHFKFTHKIKFQERILEIESSFSCNYRELKQKISDELKIPATQLRLLNSKKQEIGCELGSIPFCFMQEKQLEVTRVDSNQNAVVSFVLDFVATKIEDSLIPMMEEDEICQSVFELWRELDVKQNEVQQFIEKLSKAIEKKRTKAKERKVSRSQVYLLLLMLKLIQTLSDSALLDIVETNTTLMVDLIELLGEPILNSDMVELLISSTALITKVFKLKSTSQQALDKLKLLKAVEDDLCLRSLKQIQLVSTSLVEGRIVLDQKIRVAKMTLNCLNIVELLKEGEEILAFMFTNASFLAAIGLIYRKKQLQTSRIILTEKLKKIIRVTLSKNAELNPKIQQTIFELFVLQFYPGIKAQDGLFSTNKSIVHFYSITAFIISKFSKQSFQKYVLDSNFFEDVVSSLQNMRDQKSQLSCNYVLKAHLDILASVLDRDNGLLSPALRNNLLFEHLFFVHGKTSTESVRCLHKDTVTSCLKAIFAGSKYNQANLSMMLASINQMHRQQNWLTENDWAVSVELQKKEKYKGLDNPGCICFMNSLLQQLFMNKFFKNHLIGINTQTNQKQDHCQLLRKMKKLFLEMDHTEMDSLSSVPFSRSVKGPDQKPMISIYNQMDIDQFSNILFDRMEQQLTALGKEDFVRKIFGGTYAQQIVSHQCPHSSQREQDFLSVGLEVKKNLTESFACLVKGEILDGENKYYCERCDQKVKAQKILTIKKVPECLIISLKRFQYNFDYDAKIKINNLCQFPHDLNLKSFTQEEVLARLLEKDNKMREKPQTMLEQNDYQYKLKGVVIHSGSADSGHYYSLIRDEKERWIQFNDSDVSTFNIDKLAQQAFGSNDELESNNKNAYLLFYQKVTHGAQFSEFSSIALKMDENEQMISQIEKKNKKIEKERVFFSPDYSQFIDELWLSLQTVDKQSQIAHQFKEFLINYFLTVRIREANSDSFTSFSKKIRNLVVDDLICRNLFITKLQDLSYLEQLFVYCSLRIKCQIISCILADAVEKHLNEDNLTNREQDLLLLLQAVVNLSILYGSINQLFKFVRKIVVKLSQAKSYQAIELLVQKNFHKLILLDLMGKECSKEERKIVYEGRNLRIGRESNSNDDDFSFDKKYITPYKLEAWRILITLIEYISSQQKYVKEYQDIRAALIKHLNGGEFHKTINESQNMLTISCVYSCIKKVKLVPEVLPALEKGFKDFQSTKFRPLLVFILCILHDSETSQEIIKRLIFLLDSMLTANQKYFLESNLLLQWIIKFINANQLFAKMLKESESTIDQALSWLETHRKPSVDLVKKHKNPLNERLLNRINGILVSADTLKYQQQSKLMQQTFLSLQTGTFKPSSATSEIPTALVPEYKIGQTIKYCNVTLACYKYGRIVSENFGRLKIKVEGKNSFIEFEEDDEKLMMLSENEITERVNENKQNSNKKEQ